MAGKGSREKEVLGKKVRRGGSRGTRVGEAEGVGVEKNGRGTFERLN